MKMNLLSVVVWLLLLVSCKKSNVSPQPANKQLFPLTKGNQWMYVDSFFDIDGAYAGMDTFHLKTAANIVHNNQSYTPISDQYEQAVFTVRSNDSSVFLWKPAGEVLLFNVSLPATVPYINNSYFGDTLASKIYTRKISTMGYPSYQIIVTQDDGLWYHYVQDEYFFSVGIGIIKGITRWKNDNNEVYISDSYRIIYYYGNKVSSRRKFRCMTGVIPQIPSPRAQTFIVTARALACGGFSAMRNLMIDLQTC